MIQIFQTKTTGFTIATLLTCSIASARSNPKDDFRKYLQAIGLEDSLYGSTAKSHPLAKRSRQNALSSQNWTVPFTPKGILGGVSTLDAQAGKVVVAGGVAGADGLVSSGLALWNGTRWTSLDQGLGGRPGERAHIIKIRLYGDVVLGVGPMYSLTLDGNPFEVIRWDGSRWKGWSLDSGSLASDIMLWNNRIWVAASSGLWEADTSELKLRVSSAEEYAWMFNEKGSELWGCGKFYLPQDTLPRQFARWTGSAWVDHLPPIPAPERGNAAVFDFAWHEENLFALIQIHDPFTEYYRRAVMRWDGKGWETLPFEINRETQDALEVSPKGLFFFSAELRGGTIWKWDGAAFQVMLTYTQGYSPPYVAKMKMDGDRIYLTGRFLGIDSVRAENVAAWNGSRWSALSNPGTLGPTIGHPNYPLVMGTDGRRLYFGGPSIYFAGEKPAGGLATWDGTTMDNLGGGLKTARGPQQLYMYLSSFGFQGEKVYAGGRFDSAGTHEARNIAVWDGKNWHPLGEGYPGSVEDILVFENEVLIAGLPDSVPPSRSHSVLAGQVLGRWTGTEWQKFGDGITGRVLKLFAYQGKIHIGGRFQLPNDTVPCLLARWDGGNWTPLIHSSKQVRDGSVTHAEIFRDDLFITGGFFNESSGTWRSLMKWDGTRLTPFDSVQVDVVGPRPLVSMESKLFLVGHIKGQNSKVIYWDGSSWHSALSDPDITVNALGEFGGDLYLKGEFEYFGGEVAYYMIKMRVSNSGSIMPFRTVKKNIGDRFLLQGRAFRVTSPNDGTQFNLNGRFSHPRNPLLIPKIFINNK
jgi:hypothetical protein